MFGKYVQGNASKVFADLKMLIKGNTSVDKISGRFEWPQISDSTSLKIRTPIACI